MYENFGTRKNSGFCLDLYGTIMYHPHPYSSRKLDYYWNYWHRHLKRASTFRIVVIAIIIHSLFSILLIHNYLNYYKDTYQSKHHSSHDHPDKGKVSVLPKKPTSEDIDSEQRYRMTKIDFSDQKLFGPRAVNLLNSKLIKSQELTHIGWFSDHFRWEEKIQCFNNRWTLCDKVYIAKCRPNSIRAIYQFVPFKRDANVRHLHFSLRATSEQLVEQSNDGFYGLLANVEFIDGTIEVIKLKFPYESEAWSLRVQEFRSRLAINSVTVMLVCYGYSGIASFTDVRLTSESAGIDPLFSRDQICSWCSAQSLNLDRKSPSSDADLSYEILKIPPKNQAHSTDHQVTFVSQVSMDRLTILEQSLRTWPGPISISIYIPIDNSTKTIQDWQRLYINKKISSLNTSLDKSTIILVPSSNANNYPINLLRNLAVKMVRTRFMFLVDADFQPSPNLEGNFLKTLEQYHHHYLQSYQPTDYRIAFVVPAFEYLEMPNKEDSITKTKDELLQLIHRDDPMIEPFRLHESNEVQGLTNYWKWYHVNEPYNISFKFHDKYEPYIIVEKTFYLPAYDENLTNYGMNKVMHISEMFALNYTFEVLDNVWAIHFQHRSTPYYGDFIKNLNTRLGNRHQRFKVLQRIIHQHQIILDECQKDRLF